MRQTKLGREIDGKASEPVAALVVFAGDRAQTRVPVPLGESSKRRTARIASG